MQGAFVQPASRPDDPYNTADLVRIETEPKIRLVPSLIWCAWPVFFYFSIHGFLQENFLLGCVMTSFTCITTILAMHFNQSRFKAFEKRTRQAYEELKIAQSQLVQSGKLASIGELAAEVAHELNQPLMVIRGYSQRIHHQMKNRRLDEKELSELLETIERNTKRMMIIISHLRAFSRLSTAGFQPVDLNRVIEDAFLMIGEQLRLRGIHVTKNLDAEGTFIQGDARQLEQVFLNLLSNARDALSVTPTCYQRRPSDRRITIATRSMSDPAMVEVLVSDNGDGIPAENLEAIFDPFFTTKAEGKGTGLGLSISYGIIQKHGGRIEVKDTGPDGTTFALTFPAPLRSIS